MPATSQLEAQLRHCIVRIIVSPEVSGTGFFVAPGLVLTCAHVVDQAHDSNSTLEIRWGKQIFQTNKIEKFLAKPYPDLALLRIDPFEHPCVYFDSDVETNDQFYSYGFSDLYPNGDSSMFVYEGPTDDEQLLKLKATQVRPGQSGAPLLSHRTGGVCGLVNKTRDKNTDLGGRGVPATVILESIPELVALQREVHAQDSSWLRLLNPIDPDWLKELSDHLEQKFVDRMQGGDSLTRQEATAHYVELLVRERVKPSPDKPAPAPLPLASLFEQTHRPAGDEADDGSLKLLIFSEGGGGKTTSLLKLAVDAARNAMIDPLAPIPVFIQLNAFDTQERGSDELWEMICKAALLEKDKMQSQLKTGGRRFLFLMDGFNEIGPKFQEACVLALQEFLGQGAHSYVITSRPGGWAEKLSTQVSGIKELEMVQLDEDQIQDFLVRHGATGLYEQMGEQVKGLARNPFMLRALAQSCIGIPDGELPRNIGQLYQTFIDEYVFEKREIEKVPSPTEYNYLLVKKQILSSFALDMTRDAITRREEDMGLRKSIAAQLKQIRSENEGAVEIKPYELMPDPPVAKALIDEAVNNGVLRRVGNSLEFMHQSVQDYFSAIAISTLEPRSAIAPTILELTPPLSTQLSYSRQFKTNINRISYVGGRLFGTTVMVSGLLPDSSELVKALRTRDQLLAAHCFGSAVNVESALRDELREEYLTLLDRWHERHRWVGCRCLAAAQLKDEKSLMRLREIAENDPDTDVRWAAMDALFQLSGAGAVRELQELWNRPAVEEMNNEFGGKISELKTSLSDTLKTLPPEIQISFLNDFIGTVVTPGHPERESATLIVRSFYSESIAVQLIETLQATTGDNHARATAAAGLGIMEVDSALEPLLVALKDDATEVRLAAAQALTLIKDETAIPSLLETLIEQTTKAEDVKIRESAARILDDVPGGRNALYAPINEALDKKEWATALRLIGEDDPYLPTSPELYLLRNFAYQGLERWEEALADCTWFAKNGPPSATNHYFIYTIYVSLLDRLNRWEDALAAARKTVERFPNEAETHTVLAWQCYRAGQYEEGITASQNALVLGTNQPIAAFNLGLLWTASGPDKAAGAYQQALGLCGNLDAETVRAHLDGAIANLDALAASRPELASAINEQKKPLVKAASEL